MNFANLVLHHESMLRVQLPVREHSSHHHQEMGVRLCAQSNPISEHVDWDSELTRAYLNSFAFEVAN